MDNYDLRREATLRVFEKSFELVFEKSEYSDDIDSITNKVIEVHKKFAKEIFTIYGPETKH